MERTQKGRVFQPVPAEVERIGKIVLDAAYKVHALLDLGYSNRSTRLAMLTKFARAG